MDRRSFCAGVLAALLAAAGVRAHPDHREVREGGLVIDIVVSRNADRVDVLMRTPLDLLSGVGLPLTGDWYVDVVAFRGPDPIAGDGRTYEERAVSAVRSAFRLEQDGAAVPLMARSVRLVPADGGAPEALDTGRTTIAAGSAGPKPLIDARNGFLDVHFTGDIGDGPVVFVPALATGAGSMVTFRVVAGESEEPISVSGGGEPVRLAPSVSHPTRR